MDVQVPPGARVYVVKCEHDPDLRAIKWQPDPRYRANGFWTERCYECDRLKYMRTANIRRAKRTELKINNSRKRWAGLLWKEWPAYFTRHPEQTPVYTAPATARAALDLDAYFHETGAA